MPEPVFQGDMMVIPFLISNFIKKMCSEIWQNLIFFQAFSVEESNIFIELMMYVSTNTDSTDTWFQFFIQRIWIYYNVVSRWQWNNVGHGRSGITSTGSNHLNFSVWVKWILHCGHRRLSLVKALRNL